MACISDGFVGQECIVCRQPIHGKGVIADIPGFPGICPTPFHLACYLSALQQYADTLQAEVETVKQRLSRVDVDVVCSQRQSRWQWAVLAILMLIVAGLILWGGW